MATQCDGLVTSQFSEGHRDKLLDHFSLMTVRIGHHVVMLDFFMAKRVGWLPVKFIPIFLYYHILFWMMSGM